MDLELEIFRNLFVSIAEEMGTVLRRTSFSPNIKERRDYSCAVYDRYAETIAMGDHMPVHLGAMPTSVTESLNAQKLEIGDVVILNDPFCGGTHLPDITSVSAVFQDNEPEPVYYLATRAHHSDVGGMAPGSMPPATEIFQEGTRIPPVKVVRKGVIDEDILNLVLLNSRTPEERRGDIGAQLAAHSVGERRLTHATNKYGIEEIQEQMVALKNYSERLMENSLTQIPNGVYEFEDFLDDDGFGSERIRIHCTLTIEENKVRVDFCNSAAQTRGGINANRAIATAATMYTFRCLIYDDAPYNAGMLRPVEIITQKGSLLDPLPPASVAAGNVETSQRIVDVLLGALSKAIPNRIPAASAGTMNNLAFGGLDSRSGEPFAYYETIGGGMGAGSNSPGLDACHTHMSNSLNTPVEALERELPVKIRQYAIAPESSGKGRYRGGSGVIKEFEFMTETDVSILSDRRTFAPYGLENGGAGQRGKNFLNGQILPGKTRFQAKLGDRLRIETPGGGAHGGSTSDG